MSGWNNVGHSVTPEPRGFQCKHVQLTETAWRSLGCTNCWKKTVFTDWLSSLSGTFLIWLQRVTCPKPVRPMEGPVLLHNSLRGSIASWQRGSSWLFVPYDENVVQKYWPTILAKEPLTFRVVSTNWSPKSVRDDLIPSIALSSHRARWGGQFSSCDATGLCVVHGGALKIRSLMVIWTAVSGPCDLTVSPCEAGLLLKGLGGRCKEDRVFVRQGTGQKAWMVRASTPSWGICLSIKIGSVSIVWWQWMTEINCRHERTHILNQKQGYLNGVA